MILLDTNALLWLRFGSPKLGPNARRRIDQAWQFDEVAVSAISFWELALLKEKRRIRFSEDVGLWRREQLEQGMVEIPLNGEIAVRSVLLPGLPPDPADRIIVATALEGHTLITSDDAIIGWPGNLSRLDARR